MHCIYYRGLYEITSGGGERGGGGGGGEGGGAIRDLPHRMWAAITRRLRASTHACPLVLNVPRVRRPTCACACVYSVSEVILVG